jgi:hypothetical protein
MVHIIVGTLSVVLWQPLSAITVTPDGMSDATCPAFLAIGAALGAICGYG